MISRARLIRAPPENISAKHVIGPEQTNVIHAVLEFENIALNEVIVATHRKKRAKEIRQLVPTHDTITCRLAAGHIEVDAVYVVSAVTQGVVHDAAVVAGIEDGDQSLIFQRVTRDIETLNSDKRVFDVEALHGRNALRLESNARAIASTTGRCFDMFVVYT